MKKVIVEVSGGVVQAAYADDDVEVVIIDWDNQKAGDPDYYGRIASLPLTQAPSTANGLVDNG